MRMQPLHQLLRRGIGLMSGAIRPGAHLVQQLLFLGIWLTEEERGGIQCFAGRIFQRLVAIALLFQLLDLAAQNTYVWPFGDAGMPLGLFQRLLMLDQGGIEGFGRGEETFFEQLDDKFSGVKFAGITGLLDTRLAILLEKLVDIALLLGI